MSIVVSVKVADGLVVAADSASTLSAKSPKGEMGVAKVFSTATKVMQLRDYPMVVASWGEGTIGSRTISSLVYEYANTTPPLKEIEVDSDTLSVESEARRIHEFLLKADKEVNPKASQQARQGIGVVLGGYSGNEFFPEIYVMNVPQGEFTQKRKTADDGTENFGAHWFGITDALVRFHHGRDERLRGVLEREGLDATVIDKVFDTMSAELEYPVPFGGMPLQDAIDYAEFMAGLAVARHRFVLGPEVCGGAIDVAAITRREGFIWVKQKTYSPGKV